VEARVLRNPVKVLIGRDGAGLSMAIAHANRGNWGLIPTRKDSSFRTARKRRSGIQELASILDSRFRGNDDDVESATPQEIRVGSSVRWPQERRPRREVRSSSAFFCFSLSVA
jgi:hypothetical protein